MTADPTRNHPDEMPLPIDPSREKVTADPRPWPTEPVEMYTWYSFRWGVSPRMNQALDDWAELNYDWIEYPKERHAPFKSRREMIHKFMWDAVWHQFNNWRREWDEYEAQSEAADQLKEREKECANWPPADDAAEALRDILEAGFVPVTSPFYTRAITALAAAEAEAEAAMDAAAERADQGPDVLPSDWHKLTKLGLLAWLDEHAFELTTLRGLRKAELQEEVRDMLLKGYVVER